MRVVVLIIALLGAVTSGFLGVKWFNDSRSPEAKAARELVGVLGQGSAEAKAAVAEYDRLVLASYFLMRAAVLRAVGRIPAYTRKRVVPGLVPLTACAVPPGPSPQ